MPIFNNIDWDNIAISGSVMAACIPKVNPLMYYGGPVLTNLLGCLHSTEYKIVTTTPEKNSVGFTLDRKMLECIAQGGGPRHYMVTLGLANWEPGQLENEFDGTPPKSPAFSWLTLEYLEL